MRILPLTSGLKAGKESVNSKRKPLLLKALNRVKKPVILLGLAVMLTACAKPKFVGCNDISCRPVSNDHAMTIWWQPDMRNGPFDFTQASVNE